MDQLDVFLNHVFDIGCRFELVTTGRMEFSGCLLADRLLKTHIHEQLVALTKRYNRFNLSGGSHDKNGRRE